MSFNNKLFTFRIIAVTNCTIATTIKRMITRIFRICVILKHLSSIITTIPVCIRLKWIRFRHPFLKIISTIINMGKTLHRKVVAEGVETEEQLSILREYRCDEIQGYFFSRPMPAPDLTAFLQEKMRES